MNLREYNVRVKKGQYDGMKNDEKCMYRIFGNNNIPKLIVGSGYDKEGQWRKLTPYECLGYIMSSKIIHELCKDKYIELTEDEINEIVDIEQKINCVK